MAAKEGVPPCSTCCANDWKAAEYDKTKFEGTWVVEGGNPSCCGKVKVDSHCLCYTCVCFSFGPCCIPDLTWTCGDNCWLSQGGSSFIYGEEWCCCPYEKWTREVAAGAPPSGNTMDR